MKPDQFSILQRIRSFKYAFSGLKTLMIEEHNARIHLIAAITVILIACLLQINQLEWIVLIFCIALVFCAEAFNSAIENFADFVAPQKHPHIKKIKDLSAAAVLITALASSIIGLIIFIPRLIGVFKVFSFLVF